VIAELPEQGNIDSSVAYFETVGFEHACKILDVGTRFGSFLQRLDALG
jgi:L-amino acid N-acyltransferase YncA